MAQSVIVLRVLRRGHRTDDLLAALAVRFERDALTPDDSGAVRMRVGARGPAAWEAVRDALDDIGADWRQWLHLEPRPTR